MERLADTYDREQPTSRTSPSLPSTTGFAFDLFAFAAVAVVLVLVMQTPTSFQDQLVLHYDDPTLHALYTTHFVHNSMAHLRGNLIAYGIVVPLTYLLCLRADRHREFRLSFLGILFVLPPIISVVSLFGLDFAVHSLLGVDPHAQSSRGFSALDGAFVGVLMVAVADSLRTASGRDSSLWPSVGFLFCIGLADAFWNVLQYTTTPLAFVLILVPICYASWLLRSVEATYELRGSLQVGGWLHGGSITVGLLVLGTVVSVWYVQVLLAFPPFVGGRNTLSHFVGLVLGILTGYRLNEVGHLGTDEIKIETSN